MPINIAALVYALLSLGGAWVVAVRSGLDHIGVRMLLSWALLAAIGFLLSPGIAPLVLSAIVLAVLMPSSAVDRVIYFVGIAPAMPDTFAYEVPFPGINYLIELTYFMVAVLVVLVPILLSRSIKASQRTSWTPVDFALLAFLLYVGLMSLRDAPITTALRNVVELLLVFFVPYFAISRSIRTPGDVSKLMRNLLVLGIVLGVMAAASTALRWDFYRLWDFWTAREFRGGFLRIQLTTNTASLCTMLAMALAAFELVRSKESRFGLESWGIRGLIAFAVFVTGNRGGLIQLIMTFAAFSALSHLGARTRSLMITAGVIVLIGVATSFQSIDWSRFDERGTFQYRADLISASLRQISEAPLFGRRDYLDLGHFDHLRQFHIASDDFVDVVIYYLQIALEFGLVGLAPFVFAYFSVLIALYRRLDAPGLDDVERRQRIATISMLAPYLFVIATTSNVSLLPMLGTMMLGIGSAQLRFK